VLLARILAALAGAAIIVATLDATLRTFVVPRGLAVPFARVVFVVVRRTFALILRVRRVTDHAGRDRVLAFGAPIAVLALPAAWLFSSLVGFALLLGGIGGLAPRDAIILSGSSLLTLGFALPHGLLLSLVAFAEAAIGVGLLAVVITYLPAINAAFSRRELVVASLDARAQNPPSALALILRHHQFAGLDRLDENWRVWETWIVDVGDSHMTHAMLPFFRSSTPAHSWVTALGCLLDASNLRVSAIRHPGGGNTDAYMFHLAASAVIRRIAAFFGIVLDLEDGVAASVTPGELDEALAAMAAAGVPMVEDLDLARERFFARRAQYDRALLGLCRAVEAPPAPWSSDRA
jgi:hypothetical protein